MINQATRTYLLALARATLANAIGSAAPEPDASAATDAQIPCGAFVSLHTRGAHVLRGCIGTFDFARPLAANVRDMAVAAGLHDPRFAPVTATELADLVFEISAMTPPQPCKPEDVVVGTHGLLIGRGSRRGVLLPQVPVEWGWGPQEFLVQTCRKAGLPDDAWRDPGTDVQVFTAEIFGD